MARYGSYLWLRQREVCAHPEMTSAGWMMTVSAPQVRERDTSTERGGGSGCRGFLLSFYSRFWHRSQQKPETMLL